MMKLTSSLLAAAFLAGTAITAAQAAPVAPSGVSQPGSSITHVAKKKMMKKKMMKKKKMM